MFLAVVELRMGSKRLAQVGHFEDGKKFRSASPVPVATKLRGHESVEDAANRIKAAKFPTLDIELAVCGHTFSQEKSASFDVTTFYWKQTFTAQVAECDASTWAVHKGYGVVGEDPSRRVPIFASRQLKKIVTMQGQKNKSVEYRFKQEEAFAWLSVGEWTSLEEGTQQLEFVEAKEALNVDAMDDAANDFQLAQAVITV